jgi:hypothetical protein
VFAFLSFSSRSQQTQNKLPSISHIQNPLISKDLPVAIPTAKEPRNVVLRQAIDRIASSIKALFCDVCCKTRTFPCHLAIGV